MGDYHYFVPGMVADALDVLKEALTLAAEDKQVIFTDEYLQYMGLQVARNEQAQITQVRLAQPEVLQGEVVDPQLDPLLAKATADPEGRALVQAILKRKELPQ